VQLKFPDTPLVLAGLFGGPLCIFISTPLRNALTLASHDADSPACALYSATLQGGFAGGWTGALSPTLASIPQFCVIGPFYHFLNDALGSESVAVVLSGFMETVFTYGSESVNGQMAHNLDQEQAGTGDQVPLSKPWVPIGPGAGLHMMRNVLSMSGMRILARPCQAAAARLLLPERGACLPRGLALVIGDMAATVASAVLSAPVNQAFQFAVTSNSYLQAGTYERASELLNFFSRTYLVHNAHGEVVGFNPSLQRDLLMRCVYCGTLLCLFCAIERSAVALWRRRPAPS